MLTILAVLQTLMQSFQMYKSTKQWQPNRYTPVRKLVKDEILYFVVYAPGPIYPSTPSPLLVLVLLIMSFPHKSYSDTTLLEAFAIIIPWLVVSTRELYDHDIHDRFHADTGSAWCHGRMQVQIPPCLDEVVVQIRRAILEWIECTGQD